MNYMGFWWLAHTRKLKVNWRSKLPFSMASKEDSETYEIAEEVHAPEKLVLSSDQLLRHAIISEYAILGRKPIDGMFIMPGHNNILEWLGILFIRNGVYTGGIFRFCVSLPKNFPETDDLPVITLETEVFHPQISLKEKRVDLTRYFPDGWKRDKHHVWNALIVLHRIFFSLDVDVETSVNHEAAILWKEDKKRFKVLARQNVDHSRTIVYEDPANVDDVNCLRFTPWCEAEHQSIRERIMSGKSSLKSSHSSTPVSGYSWIDTDTLTYMTEPIDTKMDLDSSRNHSDRVAYGIERLDLSGIIDEAEEALPLEINGDKKELTSPVESMKEGETTDDEEIGESHLEDIEGVLQELIDELTVRTDKKKRGIGETEKTREVAFPKWNDDMAPKYQPYDCVKAGDDWEEMVVQKRQIESSKQNQTKRSIPNRPFFFGTEEVANAATSSIKSLNKTIKRALERNGMDLRDFHTLHHDMRMVWIDMMGLRCTSSRGCPSLKNYYIREDFPSQECTHGQSVICVQKSMQEIEVVFRGHCGFID
ncbi:ubc-19 [Pristionchus pacificus]|uniref:Ubc-19 n=1 Tax=Pristionchus pacificus TaxID=54126 RepID=A0A2A6CSC1_PRIPA|nr:ubc-19 [Pristionchus pacificus]|eukprot:PDM81114.1 ubc-19 [Pristionchus pacificus]